MLFSLQSAWSATFDVKTDPVFRNAEAAVKAYAMINRATGRNRFCVLGRISKDNEKSAWIIWRQRRQIILWEGQDLSSTPARLVLSLDKDLVRSEADLHGSTYLVTRRWAKDVISECEVAGLRIVLGRRSH
jgi:hypothetical protein